MMERTNQCNRPREAITKCGAAMAFVPPFTRRASTLKHFDRAACIRVQEHPKKAVQCRPFVPPLSMAKSPGFDIKNSTQFPLQISLSQVGPLYWEIVQPGEYFRRRTGAVWFTINTTTYFEGTTKKITTLDAVLPIAEITVTALTAAFTGGASAIARAGAGGVAALSRVRGLVTLSSTLIAAGVPSTYAISIGGAVLAGGKTATKELIKELLKPENVEVKDRGEYAGPPWPFHSELRPQYEITGGLAVEKMVIDGEEVANISATPLVIRKLN